MTVEELKMALDKYNSELPVVVRTKDGDKLIDIAISITYIKEYDHDHRTRRTIYEEGFKYSDSEAVLFSE